MKLSEAIRLGAMLHPQCFGMINVAVLDVDGRKTTIATCALGAAEEAGYKFLAGREEGVLVAEIVARNDTLHWTRERIADWVEAIERSAEPPAVAAVDPHAARPGMLTTRA